MAPRHTVWIGLTLLSGCLPPGREGVELSVALYATDPGPFSLDGVQVSLDRATIRTRDLLIEDADEALIGAWGGERSANLLGLPGPHGTVLFYEGSAARASFALAGEQALSLAGTVDGTRPFSVDVTTSLRVERVVADIRIDDADDPPAIIDWTVDLAIALDGVDWAEATLDDDAAFDQALLDGFTDASAWRLDAVD